jgi:hypothetical protein
MWLVYIQQHFLTKMNIRTNLLINNSVRWFHDINLKHIDNNKQTKLIDLRRLKENFEQI